MTGNEGGTCPCVLLLKTEGAQAEGAILGRWG